MKNEVYTIDRSKGVSLNKLNFGMYPVLRAVCEAADLCKLVVIICEGNESLKIDHLFGLALTFRICENIGSEVVEDFILEIDRQLTKYDRADLLFYIYIENSYQVTIKMKEKSIREKWLKEV